MATKRFCDRCYKELKASEMKFIQVHQALSRTDLCDSCFGALKDWLNLSVADAADAPPNPRASRL